ncbi:MAG: hypothetical protein J7M40_13720 [Planctomycetes bacterium]|nr:hypothetical protein [Planctomycetota bacterium]
MARRRNFGKGFKAKVAIDPMIAVRQCWLWQKQQKVRAKAVEKKTQTLRLRAI